MKLADFGLTGNFNFSLNGPTEYPNALVEVLFMSSLPEEELLADPAYRTRLARGVVDGILDYLAQVRKSVKGPRHNRNNSGASLAEQERRRCCVGRAELHVEETLD